MIKITPKKAIRLVLAGGVLIAAEMNPALAAEYDVDPWELAGKIANTATSTGQALLWADGLFEFEAIVEEGHVVEHPLKFELISPKGDKERKKSPAGAGQV